MSNALTHIIRVRPNRPNRDLVVDRHPADHPQRSLRGKERGVHLRAGSSKHVTAAEAKLIQAAAKAAGFLADLIITEIRNKRRKKRRPSPQAIATMDAVTVALDIAPAAVSGLRKVLAGADGRQTMPELIVAFRAAGVNVPAGFDKIPKRSTLIDRLGRLLP